MKIVIDKVGIVELSEDERQMILMALGRLAVDRPGFEWFIGQIADKLQGRERFQGFKDLKKGETTINLPEIRAARGAMVKRE